MTYGKPATCRRAGCGEEAVDDPRLPTGDQGWCPEHLQAVRAQRHAAPNPGMNRRGRPINHETKRSEA